MPILGDDRVVLGREAGHRMSARLGCYGL